MESLMNLRRVSAGILVLVVSLIVGGCGMLRELESQAYDLAWLDDGWIYYQYRNNSDAPVELWRRHPDGSDAARFATPAPADCPATGLLFLFAGPGGGVGVGTGCAEQAVTVLSEYPTAGGDPIRLAEGADVYGATWAPGGTSGYVERQAGSCWGVAPVADGKVVPSAMTVTVQGKSWPVAPEGAGCPAGAGAARSPMLTRDGRTLFFLVTADQRWHDPEHANDSTTVWQLMRSDNGGSPQPVGEPLVGATDLAVSPDGAQIAVELHEKVVLRPVAGGPDRSLGDVDAFDLAFSPDGKTVMTTTLGGGFRRFDLVE
jgi:hypothetical protein